MANIAFKKGLRANLPAAYTEGTFYVTTDERAIYLDVSNESRIRLGDFQEFATLAALEANVNPSTSALYYVTELNVLAKWDGEKYVQINRDTGMTSVEVVGDGNAVTAAVYSEDGRKLTLTKGATYMTAADVDGKIAAAVGALGSDAEGNEYANVKDYIDAKTEGIATDAALKELQDRVTEADGDIDDLEAKAHEHANKDVLDGITAEKVADWDDAVSKEHVHENAEVLNGITAEKVAEWDAKQAAGDYATKAEAQGYADAKDDAIAAAKKAGDDAMAEAQKKVASVTAGDGSMTVGGTATDPTVAVKLSQDADNAIELVEDGLKVVIPAAAEYTIEKAAESGDFAAVYTLKKNGAQVGASINIPKDMVVESGAVVENPEGQAEGTYIKLVLQNVAEPLYINVGSLIEYVTSGSAADDMVVISVSDDHKVTAAITDGSITLAKLATDVQTAIGKAHSHENADVLAGINADKVDAWDAAEANAEEYADELNEAMDLRMQDVEGKAHEHSNKDELDKIADGDVAKWNTAATDTATIKGDYLKGEDKTALEGEISKAQAAAEKVANDNNAAMDERVKALEEIDHEAYKGYADQAETDAVATANAYTDAAMAWGSF